MRSASSAARSCSLGALLLLGLLVVPALAVGFDPPVEPRVAPTVLSTVPAARAIGVPLAVVIEVRFSEAMNASTLAFNVQPPVPITVNWTAPDQLRLEPSAPGLSACTPYAVLVAARDVDEGFPLAEGPVPNPWSFMTVCASPFILATSPAHDAGNIRTDADIVVTFSEPMNFSSTLRLLPSPPSMFTSWDATRTVMTGRTTLQPGTNYTATVNATDDDGNFLVPGLAPNPWRFRVNRAPTLWGPNLTASGCLGGGTALAIEWTMTDDTSRPEDLTVRLSFLNDTVEETIAGPVQGFPSTATYVWTLPRIDVTTRVRLRVNDSAGGVSTADGEVFRIDTGPPRVASTNPTGGATDVPLGAAITVVFSEPMNRTSVEGALDADPPLAGAQFQWSPDGRALTVLPGGLRDRTAYRVTVGAASLDTCGPGRPMGTDFTFAFTTAKAPSPPPALVWTTEITETSVSLAWEPVTTFITGRPIPGNATITYRVYRGANESDPGQLILEANGTQATDRQLQPSTLYVYRVRSVVDGVVSEGSAPLAVRTRDPFFTTQEGRIALLVAFGAAAGGIAVGAIQWERRRRREAEARLAAEIQEIVDQVRGVRAETDPAVRQEKEEALRAHFQDLVEGAPEGKEGRPDSRLEGLYRALAAALVQSPEVDISRGREVVDLRLGDLTAAVRKQGATYRLLSEAEASVASDLFRGLPQSGRKALLLVYFYGLEEYLGRRLRALVPQGATVLLGERGHINVRRRGWESQWSSLSLGTLVYLADRNRHFFVANEARWEDEVEPLLREAVEARNRTAHPSEAPPELSRVRKLVYGTLAGLEGVLRTGPTSGVGA